jgi:peptidoglycan-associated lipoprotein
MFYLRMISYTFWGVLFIAFLGCASSETKPDAMSGTASGSALKDKQTGATPGGEARESKLPGTSDQGKEDKSAGKSSLDDLQAGKSTPSPLRDVLFEYDRYDLTSDAREILQTNADWLKKNAAARVEVEGHCDERGTNDYNIALGAKRAQTAKDYLVRLGIAADRISTISYGEEIPVCTESTENCWRQNRRARFVVVASRPAS